MMTFPLFSDGEVVEGIAAYYEPYEKIYTGGVECPIQLDNGRCLVVAEDLQCLETLAVLPSKCLSEEADSEEVAFGLGF